MSAIRLQYLRRARALLLAAVMLSVSTLSSAALIFSVNIAPPVLPVYAQPIAPGPGYIWTPGYWAYGPDGYFWVPGTWVLAPFVGALWTPGYWGWGNGVYLWHAGYWGPHVGFYGGVNYGFGYFGTGFQGGYWRGGAFYYNRAAANVNVTSIHNTYNTTIVNNNINRVSYNGGTGGVLARPTAQEETFARETHQAATQAQLRHEQSSASDRQMLASVNQGKPAIAATPRPGAFNHANVVSAEGAPKREHSVQQGQGQGQGQRRMQTNTAQGGQEVNRGNGRQKMNAQGQPHNGGERGGGHGEGHAENGGGGHNR
jgi:WXXGXW repeat (2 copies)